MGGTLTARNNAILLILTDRVRHAVRQPYSWLQEQRRQHHEAVVCKVALQLQPSVL